MYVCIGVGVCVCVSRADAATQSQPKWYVCMLACMCLYVSM